MTHYDIENQDIDRNICIEKSIFWFGLLISIFFWLIDNANIGKSEKYYSITVLIYCDRGIDSENRTLFHYIPFWFIDGGVYLVNRDMEFFFLLCKEICLLTCRANVNFLFFFFFLIYWQYKHWKKWKILFHYVLIYCDRVDPENWDIDRNICIEKSIFWFDLLISIFFWLIDNANIGKKWKILFHYFSTMIVMSILKIECYSITFHFDLL